MSSAVSLECGQERWLAPIGAAEARASLEDLARGRSLFQRLLRRAVPGATTGSHRELFYLPHSLVVAPIVSRRAPDPAPLHHPEDGAVDERGSIACLVCLLSGRVARVSRSSQTFAQPLLGPAIEPFLGSIDHGPAPASHPRALPALLDQDQALDRARDFLLRLSLVFRREKQRIAIDEARLVEFWQYPYWVEVFERRRRRFDLRAIDGVTGNSSGAATRGALLEALIRDHRSAATSRAGSRPGIP